jgi:hypothetical protein
MIANKKLIRILAQQIRPEKDPAKLKKQLRFIASQKIPLKFKSSEWKYLKNFLLTDNKTITANLVIESAIFDKIKEGIKKAFKKGLAALLGALIFSQASFGAKLDNPGDFAKKLADVADDAGIEMVIDVDVKDTNEEQKVTFSFETEDGEEATITFVSNSDGAEVISENDMTDFDDDFVDFLDVSEGLMDEAIDKEYEEDNEKDSFEQDFPPTEQELKTIMEELEFQRSGAVTDDQVIHDSEWDIFYDFEHPKTKQGMSLKDNWKQIWQAEHDKRT